MLVLGTLVLLRDPEASLEAMGAIHHFLTMDMGWLFLGFVFFAVMLKQYGLRFETWEDSPGHSRGPPCLLHHIRLGMMFCTGIGSNLLYFGTTEWVGYYLSPPPLSGRPTDLGSGRLGRCLQFLSLGNQRLGCVCFGGHPHGLCTSRQISNYPSSEHSLCCRTQATSSEALRHPIDILFIFIVGGVGTSLGSRNSDALCGRQ